MKNLERKFPELENTLFQAYDMLSEAGFEILIEDGQMIVWPKRATIEMDMDEGIVIVTQDDIEKFEERQELLLDGEENDTIFFVTEIEWNRDEIDNQSNRELPTAIQIHLDEFNDYFEEEVEVNEENVMDYLNYEYMTEPKSFKIIL